MKARGFRLGAAALLAAMALAASGSALAGHGRARIGLGFYFGPGFGYYPSYPAAPYAYPYYPGYYSGFHPGYYPGPYYYPPPLVAVPSTPPQYIERADEARQAYWYRCTNPEGYYPYVMQCPGGWQMVPAQPPAR